MGLAGDPFTRGMSNIHVAPIWTRIPGYANPQERWADQYKAYQLEMWAKIRFEMQLKHAFTNFVGAVGIGASGLEGTAGTTRVGVMNGVIKTYGSRSYEALAMGRRAFKSNTLGIAKFAKGVGVTTYFGGILLDRYGTILYQSGGKDPSAVHPAKFGVNTSIGTWGLLSSFTATGAALYYGIDVFYPGGWVGNETNSGAIMDQSRMIENNQKILPKFNIYNDSRGSW